jgi:riboflavin synthase
MFTGIIASIGQITHVAPYGDGYRLQIDAGKLDLSDVILGDSIAIEGACMTVVELNPGNNTFAIDISAESISKTVGLSQPGPVNLEKALRFNDRLGGHLVSGHVDGTGQVHTFEVVSDTNQEVQHSSWHLAIDAPAFLAKYLAYKGSIVVNGTSLTVNQVEDISMNGEWIARVHINLIPHTLEHTTLKFLKVGDSVNLEVDLIARYLERMTVVNHLHRT